MSDVILIYPTASYLDSVSKKPYLPLSLLSSSAYLVNNYSVKIIDQRIDNGWKRTLKHELQGDPVCVGITSQTGSQIKAGLSVSKFVKQSNPNIPVVWGGIHPTLLPEQTARHHLVDVVAEGEGELVLKNFVDVSSNHKPLDGVNGITYKINGQVVRNKPEKLIDLNNIPDLPYKILDVNDYLMEFEEKKCLPIETSRGCYSSCAFCYNRSSPYKRFWRPMTVDKSMERIMHLTETANFDGFEIVDDNFFIDLKRAKEIADRLIKESVDKFWWTGGIRIDAVLKMDDDYFRTLERSGCVQLNPGVESGSERILELIHKGITVNDVLKASEKINSTKIRPYYTFMGGFPTETLDDIKATVKLATKLLKSNKRTKISLYHCFRPLPNTRLFELVKKYDFKEPSSLEQWSEYDTTFIDFPWIKDDIKEAINSLNFVSLFVDDKCDQTDSRLIKFATTLYRPIARYRFTNFDFRFMLEKKVSDMLSLLN